MEKSEYNNLIINHKLTDLANISNVNDLVRYKYLKRYLIEYLLEEGIHTMIMDNRARFSAEWTKFYLQYDIIEPLLKCSLPSLLTTYDGKILLDMLLEKLTNSERIKLYQNLKENNYWEFRGAEKQIADVYKKYNINLPIIFINKPDDVDNKELMKKQNIELLDEFREIFKDANKYVLEIYVYELKRRLSIDRQRAKDDIKKLIEHKKKNKGFTLKISNDTEGEYDSEFNSITISPHRHGVLTHELSHFMYDQTDISEENILKHYNKIRSKIDNPITIKKINQYLKKFHDNFVYMESVFKELYYHKIKQKYGSYNEYVKVICHDIYQNHPDIISVDDRLYFYIDNDNLVDVVSELLIIEKEEYVNTCTRNYYHEELMLENLLDALLMGKIFEGELEVDCLSGHSSRSFNKYRSLSFDECLADYDTIINSKKSQQLINELRILVGDELIAFLDNYLVRNRGVKHGI